MNINHLLITIVLFTSSSVNGKCSLFKTMFCLKCPDGVDCIGIMPVDADALQDCMNRGCSTTECNYENILLLETPTCEPQMINKRVSTDKDLEIFIQVAQVGLSFIGGFGPGQAAFTTAVSLLGNEILNNAIGATSPSDENDLNALRKELLECMGDKVSEIGLNDLKGDYGDYLKQIHDIIDDMSKNATTWAESKNLLMNLESVVVNSYTDWTNTDYIDYNDILTVTNIAPIFGVALDAVYLTSTTYLGMLYEEGRCTTYNEQLNDLKETLGVYLNFINNAYDTFNDYYTPVRMEENNPCDDTPLQTGLKILIWNEGNMNSFSSNGFFIYSKLAEVLWWNDIWDQFEDYRDATIGNVYEWTHELVDLVNGIDNHCVSNDIDNSIHIIGGDGFIEIGQFRLGKVDASHFSISSKNTKKTNVIFRNDGTTHYTSSSFTGEGFGLGNKDTLAEPTNVKVNEFGIVFGDNEWCLGLTNVNVFGHYHLLLSYKSISGVSTTVRIWRSDGTIFQGPRHDFSCWASESANIVTSGTGDIHGEYIQFGNMFRIGDTGINHKGQYHLTIASTNVLEVYRDDGTIHKIAAGSATWAHDFKLAPF